MVFLRIKQVLIYLSVLVVFINVAQAQTFKELRKLRIKGANFIDTDVVGVAITVPGLAKKRTISCNNSTPGIVRKQKFYSYNKIIARINSLISNSSETNLSSSLALYQSINKIGKKACRSPDYLSLEPYKGPFSVQEARILYNRFAFGGSPEDITVASQLGLSGTINKLTTIINEPSIDAISKDLECDGRLASDPENESCDASNPNDIYFPGVRYGLYYRFIYSKNTFFNKLFMWLHDERMAGSSSALSGCEAYALRDHKDMLLRAAFTGNYKQFMKEANSDVLFLKWLDGEDNIKDSPNENYAREFWELGTTGPTGLDGSQVYSDIDIANSAKAFTGKTIEYYEVGGHGVCLPVIVPGLHSPGLKTIFGGTPYEALVDDDDDVLNATFNHPRTAEHLAEDIWKHFINPYASTRSIRSLAQIIRDKDYNLVEVLKVVMQSKAVFAEQSRKSVIKSPIDAFFQFIRITGLPIIWSNPYSAIDWLLGEIGHRPLLAPTVFGIDEKERSGEVYVLEWRNVILNILTQGSDQYVNKGFSFYNRFLAALPGIRTPSLETIDRLSAWLDVPLTQQQIDELDQYMNFTLNQCWNPSSCNGQSYRLDREVFDAHPDADYEYKLRGLLVLLLTMPDFRLM